MRVDRILLLLAVFNLSLGIYAEESVIRFKKSPCLELNTGVFLPEINYALRRIREIKVEDALRLALGEDVVGGVLQKSPADYRRALGILRTVSNFCGVMQSLALLTDGEVLKRTFADSAVNFAERVAKIGKIPQFIETVNLLKNRWGSDYLKQHFKGRDLFDNSAAIFIPAPSDNIEPALARKILALQLALGKKESLWSFWGWKLYSPEEDKMIEKGGPLFLEKRYKLILESLQRVDEEKIYQLSGEITKVFSGEVVEFTSAIEIYNKVYALVGSPLEVGSRLYPPFARNIILAGAYFLARAPGIEDLKVLTNLQFEIGLARLGKSGRWLITMGTEAFLIPIKIDDVERLIALPVAEMQIDVEMHSHPARFPNQPSVHDLKMRSDGKPVFIIHRNSLTQYNELGPVKFYQWEEVTPEVYDP